MIKNYNYFDLNLFTLKDLYELNNLIVERMGMDNIILPSSTEYYISNTINPQKINPGASKYKEIIESINNTNQFYQKHNIQNGKRFYLHTIKEEIKVRQRDESINSILNI